MGYWHAFPGAEITGVDTAHQPRYPFEFVQADAMTFDLDGYDLIHASPPCQGYSRMKNMTGNEAHPKLIGAVRARLIESGTPPM